MVFGRVLQAVPEGHGRGGERLREPEAAGHAARVGPSGTPRGWHHDDVGDA